MDKNHVYFRKGTSGQGSITEEGTGRTIAVLYDENDGYGELFAGALVLLERLRQNNAYLRGLAERTRTPEIKLGLLAQVSINERAIYEVGARP